MSITLEDYMKEVVTSLEALNKKYDINSIKSNQTTESTFLQNKITGLINKIDGIDISGGGSGPTPTPDPDPVDPTPTYPDGDLIDY